MKDGVFTHKELWEGAGLRHGTGAICCGCPDCHCYFCYLTKYNEQKPSIERKQMKKKKMAS